MGIEGLEKANELVAKALVLGKKIAQGGLDASDVQYVGELESLVKDVYEYVKSKPDLAGETKDLDFSEDIKLIQDLYNDYEEVKA